MIWRQDHFLSHKEIDLNIVGRDFPSGPVVKTLPSKARDALEAFDPWSGS